MHSKCSCQTKNLFKISLKIHGLQSETSALKHPTPTDPKQIIVEDASDISAKKHYMPRLSRAAVAHHNETPKDLLNIRSQGSY